MTNTVTCILIFDLIETLDLGNLDESAIPSEIGLLNGIWNLRSIVRGGTLPTEIGYVASGELQLTFWEYFKL